MKRRQGFTLVELMVSMALIIFIMAILSQAFMAALGVFRDLKGQGDMAEKLRATTQILQNDLAANHFDGGRRLSDPNFWVNGPPTQGFFRIWQGSQSTATGPNNYIEGSDASGIGSYRSLDHMLAFTVNLRGNDMGDFMTASTWGGGAALGSIQTFGPPESRYQVTSGVNTYNSQWAEVAWFLQPQINPTTGQPDTTVIDPQSTNPGTGTAPSPGIPLFTLYRRQLLLVPDNNLVLPAQSSANNNIANYQEMSCWTNGGLIYFNNPTDVTVPWRRFGMMQPNPTFLAYPAGLLLGTMSYPPSATWPYAPSQSPPPWGTWVPPSATPPTYPPNPVTLLPASPNYPTLTQQPGTPTPLYGTDIQLNDVISFDVRVYVPGFSNGADPFVTLFSVAPKFTNPGNTAFYNTTLNPSNPSAPAVFDTWSSVDDGIGNNYQTSWKTGGLTCIPMWNGITGPTIKAIQVTIRIWDFKTNQTRQVTIVQAM